MLSGIIQQLALQCGPPTKTPGNDLSCFKIYSQDVPLFHPLQEFQEVLDLPEETKIT